MSILDDPGNEALPTEAFADAYFEARFNIEWDATPDKAAALVLGTSYVLNRYHGRWQPWVVEAVEADEPPTRLLQAICEAALLLGNGIDLTPVALGGSPVKRLREKVGPLEEETEWDTSRAVVTTPQVSKIDDLLRGLITPAAGLVGIAARA